MSGIRVNQVGYLPESAKTAVFADLPETDATFAVVNAETGEEVFSGDVKGDGSVNPASGEVNATGDFSGVTEPGRYKITTPSGTESYELSIGDDVYGKLTEDTFKMLHLQRCGTELDEAVAGRFAHPACHMDPAIIYGTEEKIDVSGGWHDAGDYGRYVVSGAKAAADLLLAHEILGEGLDDVGIPESGDGVDDAADGDHAVVRLPGLRDGDGGLRRGHGDGGAHLRAAGRRDHEGLRTEI